MTALDNALRETFIASLKPAQSRDTLEERGTVLTHSQDHDGYRYVGTYRDHYADGTEAIVTLHKILK